MSDSEKKHVKFDVVIGNPPYQDDIKNTSAKPIYPEFMDGSYDVADKVMLITPGRFLFNAGKTPKKWNKKMLADEHLKVVKYFSKSADVFPHNDIKGGVVITYFDKDKKHDPIGFFTPFDELNSIAKKVVHTNNFEPLSQIIYSEMVYQFTDAFHKAFPDVKSKLSSGNENSITTNIFDKIPEVFCDRPLNDADYIGLYGRSHNKRVTKYILRKYVTNFKNLDHYKVFVPKSNGSGALGETLSTPVIGTPVIGHTQTFISMGDFKTKFEAEALLKYVETKFTRVLLGILKVTQHNPGHIWKYVPLQDFTLKSDIDWTKSVHEIDKQLYKKYNLSQKEINFIETHVKEMK